MLSKFADLASEVRILELEERKLELEKHITQLKSEQPIDEDCVGCCKVVDVAANLQKELDDLHETVRDMDVTISDLMGNDRKINGFLDEYRVTVDNRDKTIEELKDKNIEDLKELYDVYEDELSGLKADRTSLKSDSDIMFQNYRNTVAKLQADIKGLEVELSDLAEYKRYSDLRKCADDKTIECLEAELSARKGDSEVLMKVVDVANRWSDVRIRSRPAMNQIAYLVEDCHDAPEGPPETPIDDLYKVTVTYAFLEMP